MAVLQEGLRLSVPINRKCRKVTVFSDRKVRAVPEYGWLSQLVSGMAPNQGPSVFPIAPPIVLGDTLKSAKLPGFAAEIVEKSLEIPGKAHRSDFWGLGIKHCSVSASSKSQRFRHAKGSRGGREKHRNLEPLSGIPTNSQSGPTAKFFPAQKSDYLLQILG